MHFIKRQTYSALYTKIYALMCVLALCSCNLGNQQSSARPQQTPLGASSPLQSDASGKQTTSDNNLIRPGRSIGKLELGDTRARTLELLGEKREEYAHEDPCSYVEMHWYDAELDRNGIFVYLSQGHVFQIEAATSRYHTAEGITEESLPEEVRRHYSLLRAYVLRGSAPTLSADEI